MSIYYARKDIFMKMQIPVRDLKAPALLPYSQLSEKMLLRINEPRLGYFVAESPNVIIRALQNGYEPVSFLIEDAQLAKDETAFLENYPTTPVYTTDHKTLQGITGYPMTRGVLALLQRRAMPTMNELCAKLRRIVVLEDVMNPTNVGAIFRSAAALGAQAILLTKGCSDPLYRRAARVSMGTVFQIPWTWADREDWQQSLHRMGFSTVAMALRDDSMLLDDPVFDQIDKLAILMGSEGFGLKDETLRDCDYTVKIPMAHGVDSLNVAAASAVAFYRLCRI